MRPPPQPLVVAVRLLLHLRATASATPSARSRSSMRCSRPPPGRCAIVVRTQRAAVAVQRDRCAAPSTLLPGETDTGVVQIDSLRLDERATIERASRSTTICPARVATEAALLRAHDARLVIADAPPLACAAAAAAGIPSVVCANFTWDWIYRDTANASPRRRSSIGATQRALLARPRPAGGCRCTAASRRSRAIDDVPFVARHAVPTADRDEIRAAARSAARIGRLALVSFGGYGLRDLPLDAARLRRRWQIVIYVASAPTELPAPRRVTASREAHVCERGLRYQDIVGAVDVVISKPGYGIISDCVANGTRDAVHVAGPLRRVRRDGPGDAAASCAAGSSSMDDFLAGRWRRGTRRRSTQAPEPPDTAAHGWARSRSRPKSSSGSVTCADRG